MTIVICLTLSLTQYIVNLIYSYITCSYSEEMKIRNYNWTAVLNIFMQYLLHPEMQSSENWSTIKCSSRVLHRDQGASKLEQRFFTSKRCSFMFVIDRKLHGHVYMWLVLMHAQSINIIYCLIYETCDHYLFMKLSPLYSSYIVLSIRAKNLKLIPNAPFSQTRSQLLQYYSILIHLLKSRKKTIRSVQLALKHHTSVEIMQIYTGINYRYILLLLLYDKSHFLIGITTCTVIIKVNQHF